LETTQKIHSCHPPEIDLILSNRATNAGTLCAVVRAIDRRMTGHSAINFRQHFRTVSVQLMFSYSPAKHEWQDFPVPAGQTPAFSRPRGKPTQFVVPRPAIIRNRKPIQGDSTCKAS
jgi:hypothetical protein